MGDRPVLVPRLPLVAMCNSTLHRLPLHLDDLTFLKDMGATANPTVNICGIEGTLVMFSQVPKDDVIADFVLLSLQILHFNATQFLGPGWRRQQLGKLCPLVVPGCRLR